MSIREAVPIWHRTTCHHPGRRRRVLAAALRLVGVLVVLGTTMMGCVAIDLKLPQSPPKLQRGPSQETLAASPLSPASVPGSDSGPVPFQTVGNHVLVSVLLNQKEHATLLVDTGASHTFLTPDTAKRLGVSPAADAPMHTTTVIGGRQVEFPLVPLSSIAVGQAMRENLQVGVLASFPNAPLVDGILGGSFLKDFTMTLDYATSRLWLVLKEPLPTPPPTPALALATRRSAVPIQLVGNHVLVRAVLNHTEHVTLLLDTGAIYTLLTPTTAQRLGLNPPADAPRRTLRGADGQPHEVPFVQLSALAVGEAMRENLPVGISVLFPWAPSVDGLLGGDFLEQFKMTLDRGTRQMWLESPQTERP